MNHSETSNAFEMPVLDARVTPVSSPQAAIEDEDDKPPQLSPPIFVSVFNLIIIMVLVCYAI